MKMNLTTKLYDNWTIDYLPIADRLYFSAILGHQSYPKTIKENTIVYYSKQNQPVGIVIDNARRVLNQTFELNHLLNYLPSDDEENKIEIPKNKKNVKSLLTFANM